MAGPRASSSLTPALVVTKLQPPALRTRHVVRPRLEERLRAAWSSRLTLVCAPAGFGKSTAVTAALRTRDGPVAWVSLDESDDEPQRFWSYLGAALERATGLGGELGAALAVPQPPPLPALLTPVLNALAASQQHVLLCLDDLHTVTDPAIHEGLAFVVEHAPDHLHVVLATRADPPLPLHRWRARGQLEEVRADDLRFTAEETAAFLERELGRPVKQAFAAALERAAEGWAAGLRLAGLALQGDGMSSSLAAEEALAANLAGGRAFVLEYLAHEVLERQPPEITAFLLDTAVLDAFCPSLVDAVRGSGDARERLHEVAQRGLFLSAAGAPEAVTGDEVWYRYHRLFRTLLEGRLRAEQAERVPLLLERAAAWFESRGAAETAIGYALAADDFERAARLLDERAHELVMHGRARAVERWLTQLPPAERARARRAALAFGWALLLRGRYADLAQQLEALEDPGVTLDAPTRAELHALRSALAGSRGQAEEALEHAEQALALAPVGDRFTRASAQMALAGAQRELGALGAATAAYERAIPLCRAARLPVPEGLARAHLALLYTLQGQLRKAMSVTQPVADAVGHPAAAAALVSRCTVLLERDELAEVARVLPEATALALRSGHPATIASAQLTWSRLHRARGDQAAAQRALEEAATQLERGAPAWMRALAAARTAEACLETGDLDAAEHHLRAVEGGAVGHVGAVLELARVRLQLRRAAGDDLATALRRVEALSARDAAGAGLGIRIEASLLRALLLTATGEPIPAQASLLRALTLAAPEGFVRLFVEAGEPCARLLAQLTTPAAGRLLAAFPADLLALLDASRSSQPPLQRVTEREREILRALAGTRTYQQIAADLGVSVNTVRFHVKNIYAKLAARSRLEALERARSLGLL